jgi:Aspartate/tyrosine/aromatic aminotransferase
MKKSIGNLRIATIPPSSTMSISLKAAEMKKNGIDLIALSGGEPDFRTPDSIVQAVKRSLDDGQTHYAFGTGKAALRERIARKMAEENRIDAHPDNVIVTPGEKYALYMAMQALLNPGDEVILVTPAWVSYEPMILAAGGKVTKLEVKAENGYRLTKELLLGACTDKTKMLLICTPCNPTGHMIDEREAQIIADFLEETGVYCLSDEIYERLSFSKKPYSIGRIKRVQDQVITFMGFSKGYAMTGWRLGWIYVPSDLKKVITTLYSHSLTCTPPFIQDAAVYAFDCLDEIESMRKSYEARAHLFIGLLNEIGGVQADFPDGAFYAWVKFTKGGMNADAVCEYLLEKAHITGVPGSAFGEAANTHVRFSFALAQDDLVEASRRIKAAMEADN